MPDLRDFMTTQEAAERLRFHVDHVRRMLRLGDLEGRKFGREWLVRRKSVDEYIQVTKGMDKQDPRRGNQ